MTKYKNDEVHIANPMESLFYQLNGVEPIKYYIDTRNEREVIVSIFKKSETRGLFQEWLSKKPSTIKI